MNKDNISYEVIGNDEFLHLRYDGEWSDETSPAVIDKLIELVSEYGAKRVLVDVRDADYKASMFSDFIVSRKIKDSPLGKLEKIAYIDSKSRKEITGNIQQIIRALGLPIRFVTSEDEAIAWLRK